MSLLCALVAAAAASAATQAPPVFEAAVEAVYVDVLVTQSGAPVTDLTAQDFDVEDDGARRTVELVRADSQPLDVLVAFDVSGSISGANLEALRQATRVSLRALRPEDHVGLLTFNEEVRLEQAPTAQAASMEAALVSFRSGGTTSVYDALYAATLILGRSRRGIVIAFSDGEDNSSWLTEKAVLRVASESDVLLCAAAIDRSAESPRSRGEAPHIEILRKIARTTGGDVWLAPSFERLETSFRLILETVRSRYVLRFEPSQPRPGRHTLRVRLKNRPGLQVRARSEYFVSR